MKPVFELKQDVITSVEFFESENNSCTIHFHQHFEFVYCLAGEIEITINGVTSILKKDEFCVSTSYDIHSYSTKDYSNAYILIVPVDLIPSYISLSKNKVLSQCFFKDVSENFYVKQAMENLTKEPQKNRVLYIKGNLYIITSLLAEYLVQSNESKNSSLLVKKILIYIDQNLKNELSLEIISTNLGYNKCHISHLFNKYTTVSITDYINASRARLAAQLIANSNDSNISDVWMECGFSSQRNFNRAFKETFEVTPTAYKAQHIDTNS